MPVTENATPSNTEQPKQYTVDEFAERLKSKGKLPKDAKGDNKTLVGDWIKADPKRAIYLRRLKPSVNNSNNKNKPIVDAADPGAMRSSILEGVNKTGQNIAKQGLEQLPNISGGAGAAVGATVGKPNIGAAIGGAAGEATKQIGLRLLFHEGPETSKEALWKIVKEAGTQAALQKGGEVIGSAFFKILDKLPHAEIKGGIPLLPSDVTGHKIMRYMEGLLQNLWPSMKPMEQFLEKQKIAIETSAEKLANGMSHFKGSPEQFGELLQQAIQTARKTAIQKVKTAGMSQVARDKALDKIEDTFKKGLLGTILKSKNVEQLSGALVSKAVGHEEVRELARELSKVDKHEVFEAARTRILSDVLKQTMANSKDPLKMLGREDKFLGKQFTYILDDISEDRLEAIYTPKQFDNIKKFSETISRVGGSQSSMIGKFLNLAFILGPFRGAMSVPGMTKLAVEGGLLRTMAKVITSEKGSQALEAYVRATGQNLPRATKMAIDGIKLEVEEKHKEQEIEDKKLREQYDKTHHHNSLNN